MKQITLFIIILCCAPLGLQAQQPQIYIPKSCLKYGLQSNYSLQIVRNKEQINKNDTTPGDAGYLPTLDLTTGYTGAVDSANTKVRATGESVKENDASDQTVNVRLNLSWAIFDGFNITANYQKLKELERQEETDTRIAIEDLIANFAAEYYNYVQQEIRLQNFRYAVSLSKGRLRIVEEHYRIGNFSRLDYQQAKVDFNAGSAKYVKQQELLHMSRTQLDGPMADEDVDQPIVIEDSTIRVSAGLRFEELWNATLLTNASLLKVEQNNTLIMLDYKKVDSRNYSYLKMSTGYSCTFNKYDITSSSQRDNLGTDFGITIGFNIFDGNRRREKNGVCITIKNTRLQREQLEQGLRADLSNLQQAYQDNLQMLKLERQSLVTAKENHEVAMERYMLGNLSGIEIWETQKSLPDTEERILSAEHGTELYEISLLQISGKIIKYLD